MEHYIELSVIMAVTSNRLSIAKQLHDNNLITENNFDEASREDDTKSGIERGTELMKALKATINQWPGLMTSLIEVLKKDEAFKSIAMKMGQGCNNEVTDESTIPPSLWSVIKKKLKRNTRSSSTSIHPPISQSSLSPSTEAVHSPTQHQPSPPITISTTPLPVIPEASPCSSESSPSITVSSTTTLDNTAPTDSSSLKGMSTLQLLVSID